MRTLALVLAALALGAGLFLYALRRVEKAGGFPETWAARGKPPPYNDLRVYLEASRLVDGPGPLYGRSLTEDGRRYIYPPLLAAALRPAGRLSPTAAAACWYVAALVAMAAGCAAATAIAVGPGASRRTVALAAGAGLLLAVPFFDDDFRNGNANGWVFALASLGGLAFLRRRPWLGGVAIGAATALKLTPVLALPWLLLRRAWTEAAAVVAGVALWLLVVPSVLLGPARNAELLGDYARHFVVPWSDATVRPDDAGGPPGWSLRPLLVRTLSSETWPERWNEPRIRLASLPPSTVRALLWAGTLAILGATAWAWRRGRPRGAPADTPESSALDLALVSTAALLVSPVTFRANLLALFLPAAVLVALWRRSRGTGDPRRPWILGLVLFAIALNPLTDIGIVSRRVAGIEYALGLLFLSPLSIWLALLLARRRPLG